MKKDIVIRRENQLEKTKYVLDNVHKWFGTPNGPEEYEIFENFNLIRKYYK